MRFSDMGSEVLHSVLGISVSVGQSQWCHLGENRRLHAKLDYSAPWPGLGKLVA